MKKKIALSQIPVPEDLRSVEEEEYVAEMMRTVDRLGDIAAALFKHGIFCADDPAPLHECIDIVGKEAKKFPSD